MMARLLFLGSAPTSVFFLRLGDEGDSSGRIRNCIFRLTISSLPVPGFPSAPRRRRSRGFNRSSRRLLRRVKFLSFGLRCGRVLLLFGRGLQHSTQSDAQYDQETSSELKDEIVISSGSSPSSVSTSAAATTAAPPPPLCVPPPPPPPLPVRRHPCFGRLGCCSLSA